MLGYMSSCWVKASRLTYCSVLLQKLDSRPFFLLVLMVVDKFTVVQGDVLGSL